MVVCGLRNGIAKSTCGLHEQGGALNAGDGDPEHHLHARRGTRGVSGTVCTVLAISDKSVLETSLVTVLLQFLLQNKYNRIIKTKNYEAWHKHKITHRVTE